MTVFDEHNLMAIDDAEGSPPYAQLLAQARLKTAYESNRLNEDMWQQFQIMVPDRRWLHALKLGLLTDEEYHDGGRDNDNEVEPNYVITHLLPSTETNDHPLEIEPVEEITDFDKNVALEEQKLIEKQEKLFDPKPEIKELDETEPLVVPEISELDVLSMSLDTDGEGALEPPQEDAISEEKSLNETEIEEEQEIEDEDEFKNDNLVENQTDELSEDFEEDLSPFVSWLNSLPAVDPISSTDTDGASSTELDKTQSNIELEADSMYSAAKDLTSLEKPTAESILLSSKKKLKKKMKKAKKKKEKKEKQRKKEKKKEQKEIKRKKKEEKQRKKKGSTSSPAKKKSKSKKQKKSKEKPSEDEALPFQDRIVNSLLLNDTISSETLAQLLSEHGHLQLAQEMYDRLALKYPEKSGYFAAQIQQLNLEE